MASSETEYAYYCHQCNRETHLASDEQSLLCGRCNSDFIEAIPQSPHEERPHGFTLYIRDLGGVDVASDEDVYEDDEEEDSWGPHSREMTSTRTRRTASRTSASSSTRTGTRGRRTTNSGGSRSNTGSHSIHYRGHRGLAHRRNPMASGTGSDMSVMLEAMLGNLFGGFTGLPPMFALHSDPRNYVSSQANFDDIVTRLMNQIDNYGPAPASSSEMDALPTVPVTAKEVAEKLDCHVCFDEFALDEEVKQLPCRHLFHKACILPWLERHGTCPICRKTLSGEDTTSPSGPHQQRTNSRRHHQGEPSTSSGTEDGAGPSGRRSYSSAASSSTAAPPPPASRQQQRRGRQWPRE